MTQRLFVCLLMLAVVVLPFIGGDVFPSTTAARFRDPVDHYVQFRVFDPSGRELDPAWFGLERQFAGLPIGLGAGYLRRPTLNRLGYPPVPILSQGQVDASAAEQGEREEARAAEPLTPELIRGWVLSRWEGAEWRAGRRETPWTHVRVQVSEYSPAGRSLVEERWSVTVFRLGEKQ
jgi:hypothetical protein